MSSWLFEKKGTIGILALDEPGTDVNVLTSENLNELESTLDSIASDSSLDALMIVSKKKKIFIAGADIKEIDAIHTQDDAFKKAQDGKRIFQKLEDFKIPTICVINGACLGGGYELALSCRYRVSCHSTNVKIGLPEVNLGILPGFGGSIRLPRLLGLIKALPLLLAGKISDAATALKLGLVDQLFFESTLREEALEWVSSKAYQKIRRHHQKNLMMKILEDTPFGRGYVLSKALKDVQKKTKGFYPAPLEIIELLKKTAGSKNSKVYTLESEHFSRLATTDVSKNLIRLFFTSEKFKKKSWTGSDVAEDCIQSAAVIGAGVMGGGIAWLLSSKNVPVKVKDLNVKALAGALKEANSIYRESIKRKKLKPSDVDRKLSLINAGLTDDGIAGTDMVIEAVVEDIGIKKKVFSSLDALTSPSTVLASNTSSLSVSRMSEGCRHPERVVGLHFFNPVHRMPLVEVIKAEKTSEETLQKTILFARRMGKTVIVTKDTPGFLVNRLLLPYLNEAAYLLEQGISPERLDRIAEAFGMPMGPIELVDQVGIDVGYKVAHVLEEAFGQRMKVCPLLEKVKQKGLLGKKSGKGFYLYDGKKKKGVNPDIQTESKAVAITDQEILERMLYIMINEAARCLDEGVIDGAETVDIGMVMGTGFAPFRAGLLRYADSVGLAKIVSALQSYEKMYGQRFTVCSYLEKLGSASGYFYR